MATSILRACSIRRLCNPHRFFRGIATGIPLAFKVRRCEPEFITPASLTPRECKFLSDIDDQMTLRFCFPVIQFYRYNPSMQGKDPVKIIREALAKVLVSYYPFAGRLREGDNGSLLVDCNREGVMFIKADADVTLEQFGNKLQPPFPCLDELLYDVPEYSQRILNSPLLTIQVTLLKCGGFIFAIRFNHVMCDGAGIKQFMTAMGEMARGVVACSISPVWERHLLDADDPPKVTFSHHEYDKVEATSSVTWPSDDMVQRSFFFGHDEISALRSLLPPHLRHRTTKFELLTACLWRCRTIALNLDPEEKVRMIFIVNLRPRFNPPLPSGYYGNAFVFPAAITTVRNLVHNPLEYAVELVKQTKAISATKEYAKSVAALMVISGKQLHFPVVAGTFVLSDVTKIGFEDVDFGWGKAVFAGTAKAADERSFLIASKSKEGEVGTLVPICLPALAMERFEKELDSMLVGHS